MALFQWFNMDQPGSVKRGRNYLGGEAPFYGCYECRDGEFVSIGAIETKFYSQLLSKLGLPEHLMHDQFNSARWLETRNRIAAIFRQKSRGEWCSLFEGSDVCFAPVLSIDESSLHPHMAERGVYIDQFGLRQPAPAPRFSRTPGAIRSAPPEIGEGGIEALRSWGVDWGDEIATPSADHEEY
jgi:alpha-methylacyl-CoA racemase